MKLTTSSRLGSGYFNGWGWGWFLGCWCWDWGWGSTLFGGYVGSTLGSCCCWIGCGCSLGWIGWVFCCYIFGWGCTLGGSGLGFYDALWGWGGWVGACWLL